MALDKEIALAVDFKNAPKELQDAAVKHNSDNKTVIKLKQKLAETAAQLEEAERAAETSAKAVRMGLNAWTPGV